VYDDGTGPPGTPVFHDLDKIRLKATELFGLFGADVPVREVMTGVLKYPHTRDTFIRGPFPLSEVRVVGKLPGKALLVWLLIHHRVRMTRQPEITLPSGLLASVGVDPRAKARALIALEHAGLVRVRQSPGMTARISLTRTPSDQF
jgi:hypothetical protein